MSLLSPILRAAEGGRLFFWCPGCQKMHGIIHGNRRWSWNGDAARPTFQPSILVTGVEEVTDAEHERIMTGERIEPRPLRCHSFVTDGRIQFLDDCSHGMKGQTVELPEMPEWMRRETT